MCSACQRTCAPAVAARLVAELGDDRSRWERANALLWGGSGGGGGGGGGKGVAEGAALLGESLRWRQTHLVPNSLELAEAHDSMARVAADERRFADAADHTRAALQVLRFHYAESDPEIGNEMFKLSQLLFHAERYAESLEVIPKAWQVLKSCADTSATESATSEMVSDLREMFVVCKREVARAGVGSDEHGGGC